MEPPVTPASSTRPWNRIARGDLLFGLAVVVAYAVAAAIAIYGRHLPLDRMMLVAERVVAGHLDVPSLAGTVDTAEIGGRTYLAVGPLQILPYLPFAWLGVLSGLAGHLVGLAFGIPAAWLALPLARAFGARGAGAFWIAGFAAFGSLLFYLSVFGDFYYLAQVQSFLALELFLLEWAGRRRPAALGAAMAVSFLARPTTVLAVIPFGLVMLWQHRDRLRSAAAVAVAVGLPLAVGLVVYGWYNWARFGAPLEAGYGLTYLPNVALEQRRELGLFSLAQIPENLRLALLALPQRLDHFPYFTANPFGLSMLLVSPALITSLWAGFRDNGARLLWIAAGLVAVPIFLYYGGGWIQYGFRYALDFTPFLVALMAMGASRWRGWPERLLICASVASVSYGVLWHSLSYLQK
jgi:hypothetical protein